MTSVDTNILFYATFQQSPAYSKANKFLIELTESKEEVVLSEQSLVELYVLLRKPKIYTQTMSPELAVRIIQNFRTHPRWRLVENAQIMSEVWNYAKDPQFARRRIFDIRLALTLQHHGVKQFATANTKDFQNLGFEKVWNPLQ